MRLQRYNFLFMIGLALVLGVSSAMAHAGGDKDKQAKRPKDMGTLTIRTTPQSYRVKIDGQYKGMSGVGTAAEFYLTPGIHTVEVAGPNGSLLVREVEIRRNKKHCICLAVNTITETRPCPYNFSLKGQDRVNEGDLVTFSAVNSGTAPIPIIYSWNVSNGTVKSGLGTPTITVDSKGMGGKTINAELDVNDSVYDNKCRQVISVPTDVTPEEKPEEPKPFRCDEFEARTPDDDKARFDNCVIQAQNTPDAQLYVIIYPGTDRASRTRNTYERLSKRTRDYMVRTRGFDPGRIQIVKGGERVRTTYELWVVPPGANPPTVY